MVEDADGHRGVSGLDKSVLSAERERDADRDWTNGRDGRYTISGSGVSEQTRNGDNRHRTGSSRMENEQDLGARVVEDDGAGELRHLDKKQLSGEATDTHTHTRGGDARMVALDAPRTETQRRAEPHSAGARYLTYWLWLCRRNPADEEPKPLILTRG